MAPIKVGLIGLGQRGLQHLNALWRIPEAQVVTLCDPYPDNLETGKIRRFVDGFSPDGIRICARFDEMLQAGGLDAIYFCIPPGSHAGELIRAAGAGIHIFAEKPVSLFLDEAGEMDRAIRSAGVLSTVGFQQRHDTWHIAMKEFLTDKNLLLMTSVSNGSLESHSVKHTHTETEGGPENRVWTASYAWSGSTVVEAGIHQLDLMRFWDSDVSWAEARYLHRKPDDIIDGGDNPYGYSVTFGFESGAVANMIITRLRKTFYSDGYSDIAWDRGHLKIESEGPVAYYYDGPYPPEGRVDGTSLRHPLPTPERSDTTLGISQAFVRAAAEADESHLLNTFSSSMNSHAAVLGANVSDRLGGRRVYMDELLNDGSYAEFRRKTTV